MQITQEELKRRLGSQNNLINILGNKDSAEKTYKQEEKAKESEKVVLGVLAASVRPDKVAAEFGLDKFEVIDNSKDPDIKPKVEYSVKRLQELALEKTMAALGLITDDRLQGAELRELVNAASQFSRIVERTTPKVDSGNQQVNINFFAPTPRSERDYPIINVK